MQPAEEDDINALYYVTLDYEEGEGTDRQLYRWRNRRGKGISFYYLGEKVKKYMGTL